jgi:hypothetical protein
MSIYSFSNSPPGFYIYAYLRQDGTIGPKSEETKRRMRKPKPPRTEEHSKNISLSKKGSIPWNKGKKNVQIAWNKGLKNGPMSEENRMKRSHPLTNKRAKATCPHCMKIGDISGMKRYHFDNCKMKCEEDQ